MAHSRTVRLYGHGTVLPRLGDYILFACLFVWGYFLVYGTIVFYLDVLILTIRVFQWLILVLGLRPCLYKLCNASFRLNDQ